MKRIKMTITLPHTFSCNYCGLCCEGPVELTERDYRRLRELAEKLNVELNVEVKEPGRRYLMRPTHRGDLVQECVFLRHEDGRRLCSIYEHRPCFCRLYPVFVGYDRQLGELYVDIIHCPGVQHGSSGNLIDEHYVKTLMESIHRYDDTFIDIVLNLSRCVPFSLYSRFRDMLVAWSIKYHIMCMLNRELESRISSCTNLLQLINVVASYQQAVNEALKSCTDIFDIVKLVPKISVRHQSVDRAVRALLEALSDSGLLASEDKVVLLDNYNKTIYSVRLRLRSIRELEISSDALLFIRENLYRLSCTFQTAALPLELMYIRGLMPLLTICVLYSNLCKSATEFMYNFDAVGLSVYTRYVIGLMRKLGLELVTLDYSSVRFS